MINKVGIWLRNGGDIQEGCRLLSMYAPNPMIERLMTIDPVRYRHLLVKALEPFAEYGEVSVPEVNERKTGRSLRERWPFLADDNCPPELKILAANSITTYHRYINGHAELFGCSSLKECFETAKKVLNNYIENRNILSEFQFYSNSGRCLGKHPVFAEMEYYAEVRALPISQLFRRKRNLEGAIWRINNEIKKGDKPHLLMAREERLSAKRRELSEVLRFIEDYEKRKVK